MNPFPDANLNFVRSIPLLVLALFTYACGNGGTSSSVAPITGDEPVALLAGRRMFPANNPWNREVSADPVDPNSSALIATCGSSATLHPDFGTSNSGGPIGMP